MKTKSSIPPISLGSDKTSVSTITAPILSLDLSKTKHDTELYRAPNKQIIENRAHNFRSF